MHLQSLKLLWPTIKDEMYIQENAFFDFRVKVTVKYYLVPSSACELAPAVFEIATCTPNG